MAPHGKRKYTRCCELTHRAGLCDVDRSIIRWESIGSVAKWQGWRPSALARKIHCAIEITRRGFPQAARYLALISSKTRLVAEHYVHHDQLSPVRACLVYTSSARDHRDNRTVWWILLWFFCLTLKRGHGARRCFGHLVVWEVN